MKQKRRKRKQREKFLPVDLEAAGKRLNALRLPQFHPATFRLPPAGQRDPHFGFNRQYIYDLARKGHVKLIRIIPSGKRKGVTLVPYAELAAYVAQHAKQAQEG